MILFSGATIVAFGIKKNREDTESLGRPWVIGGVVCCFCAVTIPGKHVIASFIRILGFFVTKLEGTLKA